MNDDSRRTITLKKSANGSDWEIVWGLRHVSVQTAEEITTISRWTWRSWAYAGKIASVKAGTGKHARLLIPLSEVQRVLAEGFRPAIKEAK
jgi:hypothetical protein